MKSDPLATTSQDSIFLIAKELVAYLEKLGHEEKHNFVQRKDLDTCVKRFDSLLLLQGAID